MMELITTDIRNWWKDWEIRLIVLFSAFLQAMLVILGSRRKSMYSHLLKATVWSTYLTADWAAVLALGVLSNRLANIKEKTGSLSPDDQLTAFWAPFLLLHLGGTDFITAYSLEDNELWLRYFATLVAKTGLVGYIYFLALTGSPLAVLAATMTIVGFIKYGERSLSLYLASKDRLRDSMLSPPESGPVYPRIMEQYSLKKDEGYRVTVDEVVEIAVQDDLAVNNNVPDEEAGTLLQASGLFEIFKLLFVDLIMNINDLGNSKAMFMDMNPENAFKIIAIELSFMYDLLYTKAVLLYRVWSIAHRAITLSLTCAVVVFFSVQEWKNYLRVNICITFSLLGAAILIECHSVLQMISSDRTSVWLLKNLNTYKALIVRPFQLNIYRPRKWSESVAQCSLLWLSLGRKSWLVRYIPWLGKVERTLQKHSRITYTEFRNNMKDWICKHLKKKIGNQDISEISFDAGVILKMKNQHDMAWSIDNIEFDQSILIWHIATELCYYFDRDEMASIQGELMTNYKMSKKVSRYLLYLLVMHPSMMPTGIGLLRYTDTSKEAQKYFEEQTILTGQKDPKVQLEWKSITSLSKCNWKSEDKESSPCHPKRKSAKSQSLCRASHWLQEVKTEIKPSAMKGGKSKSVLFDACRLASQLKQMENAPKRWDLISNVWAEALIYSAYCCEGYEHAKRLSKGGELLSHVWLLMAHFGVSKQLNTSQGHAVAKLITR